MSTKTLPRYTAIAILLALVAVQPSLTHYQAVDATSLDAGLVAYYSFDDGLAKDASGTGNDGTIYGNPESVRGARGMALLFDGVDD